MDLKFLSLALVSGFKLKPSCFDAMPVVSMNTPSPSPLRKLCYEADTAWMSVCQLCSALIVFAAILFFFYQSKKFIKATAAKQHSTRIVFLWILLLCFQSQQLYRYYVLYQIYTEV